jgi:hypothetical protein
MGEMQSIQDYPKGVTPDEVWAVLRDVAERQKAFDQQLQESKAEFDRLIQESRKESEQQKIEFDRKMQESNLRFEREMKEYNRRFGDVTKRFGEVVEYMIAPNLRDKFREMGLTFQMTTNNKDISDYEHEIFLEVDVFLENSKKAMLVEVKTKLTTEDVKEHIDRLEKMRQYADLHEDKRSFLGAVAGVVMTNYVKNYALKQGFYVIEPSGETFNITSPNGNPKEW